MCGLRLLWKICFFCCFQLLDLLREPSGIPHLFRALPDGLVRITTTTFCRDGRMEGCTDLGGCLYTKMVTCPQTVNHSSSNHLIATRPGVELTTRRFDHTSIVRTVTPPRYVYYVLLTLHYFVIKFSLSHCIILHLCYCHT